MIKTYRREDYLKEKFNEYNIRQKNSYFKSRYYSEVLNPLNSFMTSLIQLVLYLYGGLLLYDRIISVGTLTIFILYVQILKRNLNSLNGIINSIKVTYASLDRILETVDKEDDTRKEYHINNGDVTGRIEFRNVSYNNIRNLNLSIEAGEKVNVTGQDREDLVDILLGFKQCEEGSILIDDVNIREYKITPLSNVFGLTMENDYILDGTIEDNIKCENNTITSDEVIKTSQRIGLHEKVLKYPDKYDTLISDDKKNFSHTEKKLICLARAIISNPQIIILDNPYYISPETLNDITYDKTTIILTAENDTNIKRTIRV